MCRFSIIRLEWNEWNGFLFELGALEIKNFERDLFSIRMDKKKIKFCILFINLEIS